MIAIVMAATAMFFGAPKVGVPGTPPAAQRMATGSSEIPMTVMTTPVTTSGKKRSSRVKTGAISRPSRPATSSAPKTARRPVHATLGGADREDRRHRGERGALHDRLPGAELPHPEGLQERGQTGDEQAGRDQVGDLGPAQLERGAHDQRHGDDTGIHAEDVLQAVDEHLPEGQHLVDRMFLGRGD